MDQSTTMRKRKWRNEVTFPCISIADGRGMITVDRFFQRQLPFLPEKIAKKSISSSASKGNVARKYSKQPAHYCL
jgi:hypothetical protein